MVKEEQKWEGRKSQCAQQTEAEALLSALRRNVDEVEE